MAELEIENIKRIVVRGTNWVGDAVMGVPALRELRCVFPDAEITLVVRPWAKGLFADADFIDNLLLYERRGLFSAAQQIREWRRRNFDLAVLFQNAFEAALIAFLARIPYRVGYSTDRRRRLLTHPLALPERLDIQHEVFYYLNIVAQVEGLVCDAGTKTKQEPDSSLSVSDSRQKQALELLKANGLQEERTLIALCPGSINSRAKRWPADRYAQLADRLIEERQANVLLIGSREELEVSAEVSRRMRNQPIMLTGKTSLDEVVSVLSLVDLLVTNDTGPSHIAAALGRPTLVIFGPTNPLTTRPFSSVAQMLRHPPDCAPCMLRDCPIDHRCMTAIMADEVFAHALGILENRKVASKVELGGSPIAKEGSIGTAP